MYKYVSRLWKKPKKNLRGIWKQRLIQWRKEPVVKRIEKPTRIDRARKLGYKAKQGILVARVRVKKGKRKRPKFSGGRRPKHSGRFFPLNKSKQAVAEEKSARKFPNCEVLNSYWVAEDGNHAWYEVILVDRTSPGIKRDKDLKWLIKSRGRAFRGKTSAVKKNP